MRSSYGFGGVDIATMPATRWATSERRQSGDRVSSWTVIVLLFACAAVALFDVYVALVTLA